MPRSPWQRFGDYFPDAMFLIYNQVNYSLYCKRLWTPAIHQFGLDLLVTIVLPKQQSYSTNYQTVLDLHYSTLNLTAHHCQLLECLMSMKQSVVKDILCVIAYGTWGARLSAAKLLFYYWPPFDAKLFDRKGLLCKFSSKYLKDLIRVLIRDSVFKLLLLRQRFGVLWKEIVCQLYVLGNLSTTFIDFKIIILIR